MNEASKFDLSIDIAGVKLSNPVMTASGTFASGREYSEFFDLKQLGAIVTKTVTLAPREGNPPPRIWETPSGLLNSIGLQNPGVEKFVEADGEFLSGLGVPIVVSLAGSTVEDYAILASRLSRESWISALELNVSCPNVKEEGAEFGASPRLASEVVGEVAALTGLPIIVKLSPNVTSIVDIGVAVQGAGASAVSVTNTLKGMSIDIERQRPRLANKIGGLSGPAIRPVAIRLVWELYQVLDIPIIGMGGITDASDAIEFILAGARGVAVGTANFNRPDTVPSVISGIGEYCEARGVATLAELVGAAHG